MSSYDERLDRLRKRLLESDLDAVLISIPYNRFYVSGFTAADPLVMEISGFVLIGRDFRMLLTDGRYAVQARNECPEYEILVYTMDRIPAFQKAVARLGVRSLGIESRHISVHFFDELVEGLGPAGTKLVKTENLVEPQRAVKSPEERDRIVRALRITEKAFQETARQLAPGMTERETAWRLVSAMFALGADGVAFDPIVASGPNAALPHAEPTDRRIRAGEPVLFDMGARKDMYCSDMSRTVWLGEPDPRFREIYALVRRAQQTAIQGLRAGMQTDQADALARKIIEDAGYGEFFNHSLGHGVGLATHENPALSRIHPTELLEGMVITVEPGIYLPDWGGVRLEEMVLVGRDGVELLNADTTFYDFA